MLTLQIALLTLSALSDLSKQSGTRMHRHDVAMHIPVRDESGFELSAWGEWDLGWLG